MWGNPWSKAQVSFKPCSDIHEKCSTEFRQKKVRPTSIGFDPVSLCYSDIHEVFAQKNGGGRRRGGSGICAEANECKDLSDLVEPKTTDRQALGQVGRSFVWMDLRVRWKEKDAQGMSVGKTKYFFYFWHVMSFSWNFSKTVGDSKRSACRLVRLSLRFRLN